MYGKYTFTPEAVCQALRAAGFYRVYEPPGTAEVWGYKGTWNGVPQTIRMVNISAFTAEEEDERPCDITIRPRSNPFKLAEFMTIWSKCLQTTEEG